MVIIVLGKPLYSSPFRGGFDDSKFKLFMTSKSVLLSLRCVKKTPGKTTNRKLNPEFTTAIRAAKLINVCAAGMQPDRNRYYRLTKFILHHVIHADTGHERGERQIMLRHLQVFEGYEFDPAHPLSNYIPSAIITYMSHKIRVSIPCRLSAWPEDASFLKIILLGVVIDFHSFTTATASGCTGWIATNHVQTSPVFIEIANNQPVLIVLGLAYTNNKEVAVTCQAVKIIAVNC